MLYFSKLRIVFITLFSLLFILIASSNLFKIDDDFFEPELVIVPLVAFDRNGGRLGYGGGFYDRTLEMLRAKRPTFAIGFAYSAQQADHLPLEATDQPLDQIVTEDEVIDLRARMI